MAAIQWPVGIYFDDFMASSLILASNISLMLGS